MDYIMPRVAPNTGRFATHLDVAQHEFWSSTRHQMASTIIGAASDASEPGPHHRYQVVTSTPLGHLHVVNAAVVTHQEEMISG